MSQTKEQQLLTHLYECEEIILSLYNNDITNEKYIVIMELIHYLENKIMDDAGFVGL